MAAEKNPFLALFNSQEEASLSELRAANRKKEICSLLTRIFLITGASKVGGRGGGVLHGRTKSVGDASLNGEQVVHASDSIECAAYVPINVYRLPGHPIGGI